jgi:DNA-binding SARP family transcriptional activator/ABC-type transport system substrate-binding protein
MDFRILGPIEVLDAGRIIPLGGAKQRAAIAVLLLHPNEVVSRDRLIEGLWGTSPPATAGHTLDTYMSRLRRALGSEGDGPRVVSRRPGYSLRVEDGELDLQRFEVLLEEGRHTLRAGDYRRAAELLRQALSLFRGPPFDDLAHASFAQSEVSHLEELPLAALEERIEADLALGRHVEIVSELQSLVAKHPFRERFCAQLMLALYRSGRQADALDAFERARHHLADELGVDPGPALQRLHEDILRQSPGLDLPPASGVVSSAVATDDVGSEEATVALDVTTAMLEVGTRTTRGEDRSIPAERPSSGPRRSHPPRRRQLTRQGWIRTALATMLVLALASGALISVRHRRGDTARVDVRPGVNLLDAKTGEVLAQYPSIVALETWYADGIFWVLTGTPEHKSLTFMGIDARTHQIVANFATGVDDVGNFAVLGHNLWVSDFSSPTLLRLDIPSGRIEQKIPLAVPGGDDDTGSFQVVTGSGSIWVARPDAGELVRVNASSGGVQKRYTSPGPGCCIAYGAGRLWFTREDGVSWLDPDTGQVGPLTKVTGSYLTVGGGFAWTANQQTGTVYKISREGSVVATYAAGEGAEKVSYDDGIVWVTNLDVGSITGIDAVTGASRSYSMGQLVGTIASGDGAVAVMVKDEPRYDDVIAGLQGDVARILFPAYFTATQEPAVTDITSNPLMAQIEQATCAKLLNFPDDSAQDGWRLQPEISASMPSVSADGRTYSFTIRPGYAFSPPSNAPVTADVIRYSIERALSPGLGSDAPGPAVVDDIVGESAFRAGTAAHISGLSAVGDRLKVTLTKPSPDFLKRLTLPYFCPVPLGTPIVPGGVQDVAPASAGPYYMALPRETGELMILKQNPNYTGPRPHFFDAFAIREGVDPGESVSRVEQGTWDAVSEVNKWVTNFPIVDDPSFAPGGALQREWADTSSSPSGPSYEATPLPWVDYLAFNASRPLFSRPGVRLAVASVLDRAALATTRAEAPSDQLLPPAMGGAQSQAHFRSSVPKLRGPTALPGGAERVAVMGVPAACELCLQVAQDVTAQLRPIGIRVRIKVMNDVSTESLAHASVDLIERVTTLPYPDGASFLAKMFTADVPATWLPSPVPSKAEHLMTLTGPHRRVRALHLADELARGEAPVAAFGYGTIGELLSERLGCIESEPFGTAVNLAALCLDSDAPDP